MPGTAALATAPASGGVDDADDAPMAVGGRRRRGGGGSDDGGGGEAADWAGRRATTGRPLPRRRPSFFAKSFLIGTLRKVVKYTTNGGSYMSPF
jgi:hypothetical protein